MLYKITNTAMKHAYGYDFCFRDGQIFAIGQTSENFETSDHSLNIHPRSDLRVKKKSFSQMHYWKNIY